MLRLVVLVDEFASACMAYTCNSLLSTRQPGGGEGKGTNYLFHLEKLS